MNTSCCQSVTAGSVSDGRHARASRCVLGAGGRQSQLATLRRARGRCKWWGCASGALGANHKSPDKPLELAPIRACTARGQRGCMVIHECRLCGACRRLYRLPSDLVVNVCGVPIAGVGRGPNLSRGADRAGRREPRGAGTITQSSVLDSTDTLDKDNEHCLSVY